MKIELNLIFLPITSTIPERKCLYPIVNFWVERRGGCKSLAVYSFHLKYVMISREVKKNVRGVSRL